MANQELKIDGNTIIKLVGSGALHNLTDIGSNFTLPSGGVARYMVKNGVCFVEIQALTAKNASGGKVFGGLPKAKMWQSSVFSNGINTTLGFFYVTTNTTTLNASMGASGQGYCALSYPVADDWVEPSV